MEFISLFDVIGPNMIGPSSSHTAGACAISNMAVRLFRKKAVKAEFILYGSFAKTYKGHGTDKALLGGVLGFKTDDRRIRDAEQWAHEMGVEYSFKVDNETDLGHPNIADVKIYDADGNSMTVRGVSVGGGKIKIVKIDDVDVEFTGEYATLIIRQLDRPGTLEYITNCLSKYSVNIAYLKMYREEKGGNAVTIVESDNRIPDMVEGELEAYEYITDALLIPARG